MKAKPQRKQMEIAFAYLIAKWKVGTWSESSKPIFISRVFLFRNHVGESWRILNLNTPSPPPPKKKSLKESPIA